MSRKGPRGPPDGATPEQAKRYWQRRRAHEKEAKKIWRSRVALIEALGGPVCRCCGKKVSLRRAEIHHMEGRDWPMSWNPRRRTKKVWEEFRAGVWLTVLCKSCNASIGDPREEVRDNG